jgi:hypothetical protein
MGKIASTKVQCGDDIHTISIWEPGSEDACGVEHVVYGKKGYIICFEDHEVELTLTTMDLGVPCPCLSLLDNNREKIISADSAFQDLDIDGNDYSRVKDIREDVNAAVFVSLAVKPLSQKEYGLADGDPDIQEYFDIIGDAATRVADSGDIQLIKFMIKHGWKAGEDELCHAAEHGRLDLVKYLLRMFENVDYRTKVSITRAKDRALRAKKKRVAKYLTEVLEEYKDVQEPPPKKSSGWSGYID